MSNDESAQDFQLPEFLKRQSVQEIHNRMLSQIPDTIAKEENGWVSDLTLPTAIQKAELVQFQLTEAIRSIFPKWTNVFLDEHAQMRGIARKPAEYASALLNITGTPGANLPQGFLFSTAAGLDSAGILFSLDEPQTIPETGQLTCQATATEAGSRGNVAAETILLMVKPLKGITGVQNPAPSYGGFEQESDASLRQRILDYDQSQGLSFVGNIADYKRWALETAGVGSVKVVPADDDTGLVTLIVTDLNGGPAGAEVCSSVYDHIMRPHSPEDRLAPINAFLSVVPPETVEIQVSAQISLENGYTLDGVRNAFLLSARAYFKSAEAEKEIKYSEIGAALIQTDGVADYQKLLLNGDTKNIPIGIYAMPVILSGGVVFTQ